MLRSRFLFLFLFALVACTFNSISEGYEVHGDGDEAPEESSSSGSSSGDESPYEGSSTGEGSDSTSESDDGVLGCSAGALICEHGALFQCLDDSFELLEDCDASGGLCHGTRCEYEVRLLSPMDEGRGSEVFDLGPDEATGVVEGAQWEGGHLWFDGSSVVDFGQMLDDISFPFSVSLWVRSETTPSSPSMLLATDGAPYSGIWVALRPDSVEISFGDAAGTTPSSRRSITTSDPLPLGAWHQVVGVFEEPSEAVLFLDGKVVPSVMSGSALEVVSANGPLLLGNSVDRSRGFEGALRGARIYSRALNAPDVASLYEAER